MRRIKAMLGILVAITVLVNGFMVFADAAPNCSQGLHGTTYICEKELKHREKTGEHVVGLDNGMQAVCYIYTEYYVVKKVCSNCWSYFYEDFADRDVHSLSHKKSN